MAVDFHGFSVRLHKSQSHLFGASDSCRTPTTARLPSLRWMCRDIKLAIATDLPYGYGDGFRGGPGRMSAGF